MFLVDCIWELFVLVGSEARGRRLEIRLAVHLAEVERPPEIPCVLSTHQGNTGSRAEGFVHAAVHANRPRADIPYADTHGPSPHIPRAG